MTLKIENEYARLTDLCVCPGESIPIFETYTNDHPQYTKFPIYPWDKPKLLSQQQQFFDLLKRYQVKLHFPVINPALPWQMYTRDTGFVINDRLYYCLKRGLPEREGEIDAVLEGLADIIGTNAIELSKGRIEGGDVIVDEGMAYVGISSRTTQPAADELANYVDVTPLVLGENVMHLDTRMTILPRQKLLIYTPSFTQKDLTLLGRKFEFIEVTQAECESLGTNVFVINPETIVVNQSHCRIIEVLKNSGFNVEVIDYSQPIAIAGSFRCTTMPLSRA